MPYFGFIEKMCFIMTRGSQFCNFTLTSKPIVSDLDTVALPFSIVTMPTKDEFT